MALLSRTGLRINIYCSMADFQFSNWQLSAILDFQKLEISTSVPFVGPICVIMPNFGKIGWTVPEILPNADFWLFKMAAATILDFGNFTFLTVGTLKRVELRLRAKLCRNRSNRGWDMAIFQFFKMAAVRHLGLVLRMLGPPSKRTWWSLRLCKNGGNRCRNFDSMQILIFCTLSLKMPIYAPKIWVFGGFCPQNGEQYERDPQKAHPWAETRRMTYRSSKSVHFCALGVSRRIKQKIF